MKLSAIFLLLSGILAMAQPASQPSAGQRPVMTNPKNRQMLVTMARAMEVKAVKAPPPWLPAESDKPFMTIAWLSDLHIGVTPGALERATAALNLLRDDIRPDMTFLTGDLNAQSAGLPKRYSRRPDAEKRWWWLKSFLDKELSLPYTVIPGDNWPKDFHQVFGSPTRSYDMCGCHFLFAATDVKAPSREVCAVFQDDTKQWLLDDLVANKGKPSFFIMHETAFPPIFLDAPWLSSMLNSQPHLLAALGGHFHMDLEFSQGTWKQLICPAIGPSQRPAFKLLKFHRQQVVMLTYEFADGKFAQVSKYQRIVIPKDLQPGLARGNAVPENVRSMRSRGIVYDDALSSRAPEVEQALMQSITKIGIMQFLGQ